MEKHSSVRIQISEKRKLEELAKAEPRTIANMITALVLKAYGEMEGK